MPDLDDQLRSLRGLGARVEPLPATEVRRRGERRRRHRRQAVVLGAVGLAAAVVVPFAVLDAPSPSPSPGPSRTGSPLPSPSPPASVDPPDPSPTRRPGEGALGAFPLGLRLTTAQRQGVAGRTGLDGTEVCNQIPVWLENAETRRGISAAGAEHSEDRELRVFTTADVAVSALGALRTAVAQCAAAPSVYPEPSVVDLTTDLGYDSVTWAIQQEGALGPDVYAFNRVGRSILAVHDYAGYRTDAAARDALHALLSDLAPSQCPWTQDGC